MPPKAATPKHADPSPGLKQPQPPLVSLLPCPNHVASWFGNESNPVQLRGLLELPVMQQALALLLERARPTQRGISDPQTNQATALGWYTGYCDAIHDLRYFLTHPPHPHGQQLTPGMAQGSPNISPEDEPWGYIQPSTIAAPEAT